MTNELIKHLIESEDNISLVLDKMFIGDICRMLREIGKITIDEENKYNFPIYPTTLDESGLHYIPYKEISLRDDETSFVVILQDIPDTKIDGKQMLHRELEEVWENVNYIYEKQNNS